jgi:hypothetical protein
MNILLIGLILSVVILGLVSWIASRPRGRQMTALANVAEGTYDGSRTFAAAATIGAPFLIAKLGAVGAADICGAADVPFGVFQDDVASGAPVAVEFLGKGRSKLMVASALITAGDLVSPAAAGKVRKLPTTPGGTYWVIGQAMSTQATDGQLVEVQDIGPYQVVVES